MQPSNELPQEDWSCSRGPSVVARRKPSQPPMGMFELAPVGIPIAVVGILYVWLIGVRLVPERTDQTPDEKIGERIYQADILIVADSPLVGKSLKDAQLTEDASLPVVKVIRERGRSTPSTMVFCSCSSSSGLARCTSALRPLTPSLAPHAAHARLEIDWCRC